MPEGFSTLLLPEIPVADSAPEETEQTNKRGKKQNARQKAKQRRNIKPRAREGKTI
jgi:hypothetical protein